jgi:hypothetical protein
MVKKKYIFASFSLFRFISPRMVIGFLLLPVTIFLIKFQLDNVVSVVTILIVSSIYYLWRTSQEHNDIEIFLTEKSIKVLFRNRRIFFSQTKFEILFSELKEYEMKSKLGCYRIKFFTNNNSFSVLLYKPDINLLNECLMQIKDKANL